MIKNSSFVSLLTVKEIKQLKKVLDKVTLKSTCFDEEHVIIEASLK